MDTFRMEDACRDLRIRGERGNGLSIAVAKDKAVRTCCRGSGRFGQDFPVGSETLFQAGSVSKPMFALTLLRYADKGIIDPEADLSGVVPEFVSGPVTFTALLSHTAGYNVSGFRGYPAAHAPLSLEDVLSGHGNSPKVRRILPYGKQYRYSGGGITIAELAFTRITGISLPDAFEEEIAKPLQLKNTGYFQPLDDDRIAHAAFGGRLGITEDRSRGYHYYPEHAAAGLWSTPSDLVRIGIALSRSYREGGLISRESATRMMTPVLNRYGMCVNVWDGEEYGDLIARHSGGNEGFLTKWTLSLTEDLSTAVMINRSGLVTNRKLAEQEMLLYRSERKIGASAFTF